jgi:hypothetical protein
MIDIIGIDIKPEINILKKYMDIQTNVNGVYSLHYYENTSNNFIKNTIKKIRFSNKLNNYLLSNWGNALCVSHVVEMNEMNLSQLQREGSDVGFHTNHIVGPFGFIPFLTLIRCIISIHNNTITTTNINSEIKICEFGNILTYDYNRDLHLCFLNSVGGEKRYVLNLHYILYPKWMPMFCVYAYKYANVNWNIMVSKLYLLSLNPTTPLHIFIYKILNIITLLITRMIVFILRLLS